MSRNATGPLNLIDDSNRGAATPSGKEKIAWIKRSTSKGSDVINRSIGFWEKRPAKTLSRKRRRTMRTMRCWIGDCKTKKSEGLGKEEG